MSSDDLSPVEALGILARQHVELAPNVEHHELYTSRGLLSLHWFDLDSADGGGGAEAAVIMGGGAMGGLLGGGGLYHRLGAAMQDQGVAAVSVGWRQPNNLDLCTHDMIAAMQLVAERGPRRFVTIGHSFGGAVAIRAAAALPAAMVPGVVTLATQSAGCEPVEELSERQLLFIHGTNDSILPHHASEMVRMLAGAGELVLLEGEDHLLAGAIDVIMEKLDAWIPACLAEGEVS